MSEVSSLVVLRRKARIEREKRVDELVKKSMRVGLVVAVDGRLLRFER